MADPQPSTVTNTNIKHNVMIAVLECSVGVMFVADDADLCRYHWCTGGDDPVQMLCAPGARVPTW